ncbi:MAG: S41 family peptidase [Alphaproteobacteria bacterium]|nr:S41 family peptidase [Alphaproteobacteria bacterium]
MKKFLQGASVIALSTGVAIGASIAPAQADTKTAPAEPQRTEQHANPRFESLPPAVKDVIRQMMRQNHQKMRRMRKAQEKKNMTPEMEYKLARRFYAGILRVMDNGGALPNGIKVEPHFYGPTDAKHSDMADAALQQMLQEVAPILKERGLIKDEDVVSDENKDIVSIKIGEELIEVKPAPESLNAPHPKERKKRRYYEIQGKHLKPYIEQLNRLTGISITRLFEHAINGPLHLTRDQHTAYGSSDVRKNAVQQIRGEISGIGAEVAQDPNGAFVSGVIPGGPTSKAKKPLQETDIITHVDGEKIAGLSVHKIVEKLKGPTGTEVSLTVKREGEKDPLDIKITRAKFDVSPIETKYIKDGYGRIHGIYVKITTFGDKVMRDLLDNAGQKIQSARAKGHPVESMAVDVRNDPGGLIEQVNMLVAKIIQDNYIPADKIVVSTGRKPSDNPVTVGDVYERYPQLRPTFSMKNIGVFQNGASASASEITTGALKHHKQATIVGTRSFGKGTVQSQFPNANPDGIVKLTTGKFHPGGGKSNQCSGIKPDIKVVYGDERDELAEKIANRSCEDSVQVPVEETYASDKPKQICSLSAEFSGKLSQETLSQIPSHTHDILIDSRYEMDPETKKWSKVHRFDADMACWLTSLGDKLGGTVTLKPYSDEDTPTSNDNKPKKSAKAPTIPMPAPK